MNKNSTVRSTVFNLLFSLTVALLLCSILVLCSGESPVRVAQIFISGAFGSLYDFGLSLFYSLPIALAGLAVALGMRSGLFNIGVEGQLTMGALAAATTGSLLRDMPFAVVLPASSLAALGAGWLWSSLLGWLKAYRGAHEVVAGIMLNLVAAGLSSCLILQFFRNPNSQNPESNPLPDSLRFEPWSLFQDAPISWHILIAPLMALLIWIFYRTTRAGYSMLVSGAAAKASEQAGFRLQAQQFWALSLGGILAGAIGIVEVFGNNGRFVVGFSPGYGFIGIAVALLGRLHPFGILLASLFCGALYKGSLELDFETEAITRDFAFILQAVIILFLSCDSILPQFIRRHLDADKRS